MIYFKAIFALEVNTVRDTFVVTSRYDAIANSAWTNVHIIYFVPGVLE